LAADVDDAGGVVDVVVVQGEDLAWTDGCLADREDRALQASGVYFVRSLPLAALRTP
jgi:hypothetical protein